MLQDSLAVLTIMGLISFLGASSTTRALGAAQSAREQAEVAATELDHANAVLEAPLVGNLDAVRAQRLIGDVLDQIEQCRARAIILDVSGVAVVDTQRAQVLLRTAEATRLLGA